MKAPPFRYERPGALADALELLRADDAKPLAGGQSLVPMMAMRLARPGVLVDLRLLEDLERVEEHDGQLLTGAMVRQRALERRPRLAQQLPLVAAALPFVGHREIRNRGTVGGSLAHADPAAELGLVAATLGASIVADGPQGLREIAAEEFVSGPFQTALVSGELLTAVRWPTAGVGDGFAFAEIARRHGDFALCGVAVHVRGARARVGLLGVAPAPLVREIDCGEPLSDLAAGIARDLEPPNDAHASAGYRRRLVRALIERCLRRALADAARSEASGAP